MLNRSPQATVLPGRGKAIPEELDGFFAARFQKLEK
jgi:hypothetical protein